ncbi:MAG: class I SAM-dependent methyltransferase, partial [Planctomycetes bacterium]|nr:class I SAM-dependent methyltransferase [Planctomycetota bacterium]
TMETVDCLQCGHRDHEPVVAARDATTGVGRPFRVVHCVRCQLAFTNPRPTRESIGEFYPPDYEPHVEQTSDLRGSWRRRLEQAVLRYDFNYPPQPVGWGTAALAMLGRATIRGKRQRAGWVPFRGRGRLLDFGCGSGRFMPRMRRLGWDVEGMDASAVVARKVEQETGIRVHIGTLPHADVSRSCFDAITMWASLEHVHDPRAVLRAAREALRPGGLLVVSVPNFKCWSFRMFGDAWFGLELPRHLVHFTPHTLAAVVCGEGFRVLDIQQIGRDGWIRRSARRAVQSGFAGLWPRLCRWKPVSVAIARWTERTGRADSIHLIAERE